MRRGILDNLYLAMFAPVFVLVAYVIYLVFMVVSNEAVMGAVQRIFYFHVGSAVSCYVSVVVLFISSLIYLNRRKEKADCLIESASEVGFVLCTIVLLTGMIWAKAAWNTYFNWEPRLVSFLILWLLLLALNLLRAFSEPSKVADHCAVLGILCAVTVPLVVFSVRMLPQLAQLHPQVVSKGGMQDTYFKETFFASVAALTFLQFFLVWVRYKIACFERTLIRVRNDDGIDA